MYSKHIYCYVCTLNTNFLMTVYNVCESDQQVVYIIIIDWVQLVSGGYSFAACLFSVTS